MMYYVFVLEKVFGEARAFDLLLIYDSQYPDKETAQRRAKKIDGLVLVGLEELEDE